MRGLLVLLKVEHTSAEIYQISKSTRIAAFMAAVDTTRSRATAAGLVRLRTRVIGYRQKHTDTVRHQAVGSWLARRSGMDERTTIDGQLPLVGQLNGRPSRSPLLLQL